MTIKGKAHEEKNAVFAIRVDDGLWVTTEGRVSRIKPVCESADGYTEAMGRAVRYLMGDKVGERIVPSDDYMMGVIVQGSAGPMAAMASISPDLIPDHVRDQLDHQAKAYWLKNDPAANRAPIPEGDTLVAQMSR